MLKEAREEAAFSQNSCKTKDSSERISKSHLCGHVGWFYSLLLFCYLLNEHKCSAVAEIHSFHRETNLSSTCYVEGMVPDDGRQGRRQEYPLSQGASKEAVKALFSCILLKISRMWESGKNFIGNTQNYHVDSAINVLLHLLSICQPT